MLKQINLKNWKSFKEATLYIDPITILIGTNSSGKSNIIDALDFLSRIPEAKSLESALIGDSHTPGIRGGLEWVVRKPETQFTLEAVISGKYKQYKRPGKGLEQVEFDCLYSIKTEIEPKIQSIKEFIKFLKSNENNKSNNSSENTINRSFPRHKFFLGSLKPLSFYDCDDLSIQIQIYRATKIVLKKYLLLTQFLRT